ncbi:Glycosidase [Ligilactobacillus sp. WC1T17]|uniref:Glycosidase n=1 Tax=Ligilactobacillus ruminis TaxID=1623 RepID=A0ABY1ACF7_9LACO|nr:Glycosidase [Ligilactobacillus ruminis]
MEKAAIYHRPESEMGYLTNHKQYCVRLKTKHNDFSKIKVLYGLPKEPALNQVEGDTWAFDQMEMVKILANSKSDYWEAFLPVMDKHKLVYAFHLLANDDSEYLYDSKAVKTYNLNNVMQMRGFVTPYLQNEGAFYDEQWAKKTIWYRVMPDRFANGDEQTDPANCSRWDDKPTQASLFGGDLRGISDHLNYISRLGFNGLYLTPFFAAYSSHKFDTIDFYQVDPAFGTKETLKELIAQAHQHNMHVMVDISCSHLSDFSLEWQDVRQYSEQSSYAQWFLIDKYPVRYVPGDIADYAKTLTYEAVDHNPHQPRLNLGNPEVQNFFLDVLTYWTRHFGIDAWCLNDADELPEAFKLKLKLSLEALDKNVLLVGKSHFQTMPLAENVLAASFDNAYAFDIESTFIKNSLAPSDLAESQVNEAIKNKMAALNIIELDGPGTIRLSEMCQGNEALMRAILAFSFVQVQTPSVFYGTEALLSTQKVQAPSEDEIDIFKFEPQNPALQPTMVWIKEQQNETMERFITQLTSMRRKYVDLFTQGSFEWGQINNKAGIMTFVRKYRHERFFMCFNLGYGSIKIVVPENAQLILSQNLLNKDARLGQYGFIIVKL